MLASSMYSLNLISMELSMGVIKVGKEQILPPEPTMTFEQKRRYLS